jgi:hypothetical protein
MGVVVLLLLMLLALATLAVLALGFVTVLLSISLLLLGEVGIVVFATDCRELVGLLAAIVPIVALALFAVH